MKEIELNCWEDFESEISKIFSNLEKRRKEAEIDIYVSPPLFRGHAKESWKLKTTLERYSLQDYSIREYYQILLAVQHAVETFTSRSWNLSPDLNIDESYYGPPPGYEFMVYLRHHSFPSPLLDWSRSPYVAAFFAFNPRQENEDKNVAIYSFIEYYRNIEFEPWPVNEARIISLGPYIASHRRHYIQQCEYTFCRKLFNDRFIYCNHEEDLGRDYTKQDFMTKYLIPRSERLKVLSKLNFMNINSYSLFMNEESLIETLAYQEIERKIFNAQETGCV